MLINEALISFLASHDLGVTVYAVTFPLEGSLPALVSRRVSNETDQALTGKGVDRATFELTAVAPRIETCWTITESLISLLADFRGPMPDNISTGWIKVGSVIYQDSDEDFFLNEGSSEGLYSVTSRFQLLYSRP